jgi:DNA mismatch endonuclease (patch repair protein)
MVDVLTPEKRRLNMSRIRGVNTKPEMLLRSALHAKGLRFRLHRRELPGSPDIVFVKARVAVFVDGCFWHGCPEHGTSPKTNRNFWSEKISGNRKRDKKASLELGTMGWKVVRIWEHDVRRNVPHAVMAIERTVRRALKSG